MRNLFIFFAIFSLVVLKNEAIDIEMDCTFDDGKSTGDWIEFGWDLIEDGLSLIPEIGAILPFLDTVHDFFVGDLEGVYFDRWRKCIISWIQHEIDATWQRDAASKLQTMARTLRALQETLEGMTSVDSAEDMLLYTHYQDTLSDRADDIKESVDAVNGAATMITPYKHAFYIELASMLLVGRRLLDMNATSSALYKWKNDGIIRLQMYRDFVDDFKRGSLKPYIENWNVELHNHATCTPKFFPDSFPPIICAIYCEGDVYCQVTSSLPNIMNETYTVQSQCICDIIPYTPICEGLCNLPDVNGCKGDFDPIRSECDEMKEDYLERETATKENVNTFFDKVLYISANAESVFGSIETGEQQYEW